ncbi:MAG TPA: MMPL family transporter, partial [Polyangiaceae bacterium]
VEGGTRSDQRAFGDRLAAAIFRLGPPWVVDSADGVHEARRFFAPRAGMFAKLEDIQKLRDDIEARWSWEVGREADLNLEDEPPPMSWDAVRTRFSLNSGPFPDGYYQSADGRALVVVVNSAIAAGDLGGAREALLRVRDVVARLHQQAPYPSLKVTFAGDLVTGLAEYGAVRDDLVSVGVLGVSLILGVLFLFFMRVRALLALGAAILVGLALTFGVTQIFIGHLNVATGFLVSIVAGNGINFGIIYLARLFEERRKGLSIEEAICISHRQTWPSTLTAALAAAAAYASLGVSEFRAFRHFAFIGSVGMLLCWVASYALLPPCLLFADRWLPFRRLDQPAPLSWLARRRFYGLSFGVPLAYVVRRAPRAVGLAGAALALAGAIALIPYIRSDPMEYNMRRMQNDLHGSREMYRASSIAADILGANMDSSMVILADRVDQVPLLKRALEARRDSAPATLKPFEAVHTIFDLVPDQQPEKLPLLHQIRARVVQAHRRGVIREADFEKIRDYLPPEDLRPWGIKDLPEAAARPFMDNQGVSGRIVLIEPTAKKSDSDLKYLMRWADSFREVPLPNGELVRGSGRAVIFADMLKSVTRDIPRSILLSFLMTLLAVMLTFRLSHSIAVLGALLVGLGWLGLGMATVHIKINFFNFIALPVSFGIGVDYAVNLVQRYHADPSQGALGALRSTGGAVILCSLTTIVGYLALLGSINQAIRSLGLLAVLGEVACLLAAVLCLPALLLWREGRSQARVAELELAR